MRTMQDKIKKAELEAKERLEREIEILQCNEDTTGFIPPGAEINLESVGFTDYCKERTVTYEARTAAELVEIVMLWRDKYGLKTISLYRKGCAAITAHPWGDYTPDTCQWGVDDSIIARNSKGKGFSSVSFSFYPNTKERLCVSIDLAFRCHIQGFEGNIVCKYNRYGDVSSISRKDQPTAYSNADKILVYGGGLDSADWRGVFTFGSLIKALQPQEAQI